MIGPIYRLSRPPDGRVMCCICFEYNQVKDLYVDVEGSVWDLCRDGSCSWQAGLGIPFVHPDTRP